MFKLCLDAFKHNNVRFYVKSTELQDIPYEGSTIGFSASYLRRGEVTGVTVTWSSPSVATVTIGSKSQSVSLYKETSLFLCIYLYRSGDKLVISHS